VSPNVVLPLAPSVLSFVFLLRGKPNARVPATILIALGGFIPVRHRTVER
jgi:hypothetical protein